MRGGVSFLIIVLAACTDFAALDDHLASAGAGGAVSNSGEPPPRPASDANLPGATAGASGRATASGTEGNPSLEENSGGQGSVAPPSSAPRDAGATPEEGGQGQTADAATAEPPPEEPAAPPGTVRFVSLVGDSEVGGSSVACISDFNLLGPDGRLLDRSLWRASVDSAEPTYVGGAPAEQAIDADRLSLWHTAWFELESPPGYPHFLLIDLGAFVQVAGFRYLPRQDSSSGRIAAYRFFASQSPELGAPVASGVFPDAADEQTVLISLE